MTAHRRVVSGTASRVGATLCAGILITAGCGRTDAASSGHIDRLPVFSAATETRIGDVDDPDVGFSFITGADVDRDGNVYVVEGSVPEIRAYSAAGALLRRIGRRGAGPGEFTSAPRIGIVGDTLWTIEQAGVSRLTLFDLQGSVLATGRTGGVRVPLPRSNGFVRPWFMRPDGRFTSYFSTVAWSRDDAPSGVRPTDSIPVPFVLFDASGEVTDTVGWADRPPPRMWRPRPEGEGVPRRVEVGGRRSFVPEPPSAAPFWEALRDGYLLVETPAAQREDEGVIRVSRIDVAGDTAFSRTLRYRPARYSAEDLDTIAARAARGEEGGPMIGGGPAVPDDWQPTARALRREMKFPEFRLPVRYVWIAQDESIWLRRDDGRDERTAQWILLDPRGRPRGRLELPARTRILWHRGDTFWAAEPDENDVQWLVRFRLRIR